VRLQFYSALKYIQNDEFHCFIFSKTSKSGKSAARLAPPTAPPPPRPRASTATADAAASSLASTFNRSGNDDQTGGSLDAFLAHASADSRFATVRLSTVSQHSQRSDDSIPGAERELEHATSFHQFDAAHDSSFGSSSIGSTGVAQSPPPPPAFSFFASDDGDRDGMAERGGGRHVNAEWGVGGGEVTDDDDERWARAVYRNARERGGATSDDDGFGHENENDEGDDDAANGGAVEVMNYDEFETYGDDDDDNDPPFLDDGVDSEHEDDRAGEAHSYATMHRNEVHTTGRNPHTQHAQHGQQQQQSVLTAPAGAAWSRHGPHPLTPVAEADGEHASLFSPTNASAVHKAYAVARADLDAIDLAARYGRVLVFFSIVHVLVDHLFTAPFIQCDCHLS
jgi:hypothetical protein